ncbi:uncharacterized protein [Anabrus simplex]|uniref:uncharacterized protein n=1 Tax=Anabrus simplex TaxID=316456 RepID=UPI0035A26298
MDAVRTIDRSAAVGSLRLSTSSLELQRVSVPQYKLRGEMALLECVYELEDDSLYSVKWYKDDEEFYRFVPKANPPQNSYKLEGIKVDHHLSDDKQVVLRNVNLKTSGLYRCEVSAEAPSFASAQGEGRMDVVFLPKDGPHIHGEQRIYRVGEWISLNCTSGKSFPPSVLEWYINDEEITDPEVMVNFPPIIHVHGLMSSALGLKFKLKGSHFIDGQMKAKCVAKVSPVMWEGDEEDTVERVLPPDMVREALFLVRGCAIRCGASTLILALLTSLALTTVT